MSRAAGLSITLALLVLGAACRRGEGTSSARPTDVAGAARAPFAPAAAELRADVEVLAAPAMRGRSAGSAEERAADAHVVARMQAIGLEPGADGGSFTQPFRYPGGGGEVASANVLGWMAGSDPALAGEYVLVGAHIDHLPPDAAGRVYPGADDNASGVAVMLAVAAGWRARGWTPRRGILFAGFGAEEDGLRGSTHYASRPTRVSKLVAMINLDMLGRGVFLDYRDLAVPKALAGIANGPGLGILSGGSARLTQLARCMARASGIPSYAPEDFPLLGPIVEPMTAGRGDFAPFQQRGVPFLFFSTSEHDDYHQPSDTIDTLDPETMRRAAEVVFRTTLAIDAVDDPAGQGAAIACPLEN
ncbi:MAG TPA: M20/M25/M40 family metallo-hydrolase [Kofleriaceae bacterium]|nr:M20/M25/M40 family metallo-hydrolase [Kofleriaceae bacterium]